MSGTEGKFGRGDDPAFAQDLMSGGDPTSRCLGRMLKADVMAALRAAVDEELENGTDGRVVLSTVATIAGSITASLIADLWEDRDQRQAAQLAAVKRLRATFDGFNLAADPAAGGRG